MKFKLDENLPVSAASVLAAAGHDVDTVSGEHLAGRPDQDVVAASTAAQRVLISLDVGLGDIRAYPPGSHAGIVILRITAVASSSHPWIEARPGHLGGFDLTTVASRVLGTTQVVLARWSA